MIDSDNLKHLINEEIYLINKPIYKEKEEPITQVKEPESSNRPIADETQYDLVVWTTPLSENDKELLSKMLNAINFSIDDTKVIEGVDSFTSNYKKLLCFGYSKELGEHLNKSIEEFKLLETEQKSVLCAPALSQFHSNNEFKKKLWDALKLAFLAS